MAKGEPHPLTGHLPPDRLPTGHRLPHWPEKGTASLRGATPPTVPPLATYGHTLRDGAATWPKGSRPLPLPGLREPHHARPPTGQTGRPTRPPTALRTPHRGLWPPPPSLATYGPLTGHPGRPRLATGRGEPSPGPPPTGQRDGRGSLWPHGSSSPPLPGHLWPKGSHTTHWPQRGGHRREAFAPPLTGHLLPLPPPADRGLRTGWPKAGLPTLHRLTDWPPTGHLWPKGPHHPLATDWPPKTDLAK
jgi:hypothetical protein